MELTDNKVEPALLTIVNGFMAIFDNINREIIDQYSNYYPNSMPITSDNNTRKFILNYVDINKLGTLSNIDTNGLKGVRLDFRLEAKIQFKTLQTRVPFLFQYIITNDANRMQKILDAVTGKISIAIVKFFKTNAGDIIVDKNLAYKKIYDNFDLNYASDHSMLDDIVQNELNTALQADEELGHIRGNITYSRDEEILTLLNSIINPETNGVTPVIPDDEKYT